MCLGFATSPVLSNLKPLTHATSKDRTCKLRNVNLLWWHLLISRTTRRILSKQYQHSGHTEHKRDWAHSPSILTETYLSMIPNKQKLSKRNWCGHSRQHHNMTLYDSRSLAQRRTPSDSESIRFHNDWLNLDVRVRSLSTGITTNLNDIKPKIAGWLAVVGHCLCNSVDMILSIDKPLVHTRH